jgi:hypothetical protein
MEFCTAAILQGNERSEVFRVSAIADAVPAVIGGRVMIYRVLQSALLCVGLSMSGCAVYEVDSRGYSAARYPSYGHQYREYANTQYRQYPVLPSYRNSPRVQVLEVYRRPVYYPVPVSVPRRDERTRYRVAEQGYHDRPHRYDRHERGEHYERAQRRDHADDRDRDRDRKQRRGWEAQRN